MRAAISGWLTICYRDALVALMGPHSGGARATRSSCCLLGCCWYLLLNNLIQNKNEVISYKELLDATGIKSKSSLKNHIFDLIKKCNIPVLTIAGKGLMWKE